MRIRTVFGAALAALTVALLAEAASAQNLATTYVMRPNPGSSGALVSALREHSRWREQNGDPWTWHLWQVANGENVGEFHARSVGHTWADYDRYNSSEFAARADAHFNATVAPLLASSASLISEAHPELSMMPGEGDPLGLAEVTVFYLKPGHEQDFVQAVSRFREAAPGAGWEGTYVVATHVNGGRGPAMSIVALCPDWACLAGPGMTPEQVITNAYGEGEASRILERFSGAYTHMESFIAAYRPDLSVNVGGM